MTRSRDEGLSSEELQRHQAEELPEREEMALISPKPPFPGLPEEAAEAASDVVPAYSIAEAEADSDEVS